MLTLRQAIEKQGLDEKRLIRNLQTHARRESAAPPVRSFPTPSEVRRLANNSTGLYTNEDGEFSSPELTAEYVAAYRRLNP